MSETTVYGNDSTGEVIEFAHQPYSHTYRYVVTQLRGAYEKPRAIEPLIMNTSHRAIREWWLEYQDRSKGKFYKLVRQAFADTPLQGELSDTVQGVELAYTDSSDGRHNATTP